LTLTPSMLKNSHYRKPIGSHNVPVKCNYACISHSSMMCDGCADWPDYEGESDSETSSETEVIVAGGSGPLNQSDDGGLVVQPSNPTSVLSPHEASTPPLTSTHLSNIPTSVTASQTAQKIMHLLDEIGTSNLVDRPPLYGTHFIHCVHCSGRIMDL